MLLVKIYYDWVLVSPAFQYREANTICKKNKDAWYDFFQYFRHFWFPLSVRFLLLKSLKILFYCGKNTVIIRWPPRWVTASQVVRTSFLGLRPRLFQFKIRHWLELEFNFYQRPFFSFNAEFSLMTAFEICIVSTYYFIPFI